MPINDTNVYIASNAQQVNLREENVSDNKKAEQKDQVKKDVSLLSRLLGDDKESAKKDLAKNSLSLAPSTGQAKSAKLKEKVDREIDDDYKDKSSYDDDVSLTKDVIKTT
ncbi:MAG: hypothetical protein WC860_09155, partial [Candidatus Margulisiibacteriota bacterium]